MFNNNNFISHAGRPLLWKIECDDLTDCDLECLAVLVVKNISFKNVIGIPRGGLRFAKILTKYKQINGEYDYLIVDDVLTTGTSMKETKENVNGSYIGVVIFSRIINFPQWILPIFILGEHFSD